MKFLYHSETSPEIVDDASRRIVLLSFALLAIGLVAAASVSPPGTALQGTAMHGLRIIIGIATMLLLYRMDLDAIRRATPILLAVCLFLLVLVLIPGIGHRANNAQRWIKIGSLSIQPSEAMKIVMVLFIADFAAKREGVLADFKKGFVPAMGITLGVCGVIFLEPDFGTAMYLLLVCGAILVAGGARVSHFVWCGMVGLPLAVILAWNKFEHVRGRFQDLAAGGGYQVRRAMESLGAGGFFGEGIGAGMGKLGYVPEGRNDFVAAIIGEEWGWVGLAAIIAMFAAILVYGLRVIYGSRERFGALVAFGILFAIALQAAVNLAVVAGIAPPKGIALPFVSAGGSSMVMMCAGIGLVANVAKRAVADQRRLAQQSTVLSSGGSEVLGGSHG